MLLFQKQSQNHCHSRKNDNHPKCTVIRTAGFFNQNTGNHWTNDCCRCQRKVGNTEVFDFSNAKDLNAEEVYKQFYHLDYAMRKLLPAIYKAYEVSDSDLNRDF